MKTTKIILIVLIAINIIGCKSKKDIAKATKSNEIELPFSGKQYQTDKNYFRAVKSGTSDNQNNAEQIARTLAINEIGVNVGVINKNVTEIYMSQRGEKSGNDFNEIVRQVSKQVITDINTVDSKLYQDNKTKMYTFWVVLEVNKDDVINMLLKNAADEKVQINKEKFTGVYNEEMSKIGE